MNWASKTEIGGRCSRWKGLHKEASRGKREEGPGSSIHGIFQARVLEWGEDLHRRTEIRLIIFFAAKNGEALYSQQKQDQELTVAQIMNSLLPNSD